MKSNKDILPENFSKLSIGRISSDSRDVPPELPPKPNKAPLYRHYTPGISTVDKVSGLNNYYAVNAPAPGIVGVASARVNHAYGVGTTDGTVSPVAQYQNVYNGTGGGDLRAKILPKQYANVSSEKSRVIPVYSNQNVRPAAAGHSYNLESGRPTSTSTEGFFTPMSPPSPVSSSYSELRNVHPIRNSQANQVPDQSQRLIARDPMASQQIYLNTSQGYDSLYEPISPRPSSQMSSVSIGSSNYGAPYSSSSRSTNQYVKPSYTNVPYSSNTSSNQPRAKEAEVDALTNLLVQSMDSSTDPDFFGLCGRCGERVIGEGRGCTAMDQVFHVQCFCCAVCCLRLQGKPFYAMESKPYCEECYMNTLEVCCVCTRPILERILRATGKPYHPACFTCVVCSKNLDGIPFTVDASNQIHCIDDFHKKFAPRCSVCSLPIMPEQGQEETVRVVALDRSFHVDCYKCEDCGLLLSSEAEGRGCYPLDKHVLCKSCNAQRVQALTHRVTTDL